MTENPAQQSGSVGAAIAHARRLLSTHPEAAAQQARAVIQVEPEIAEAFVILAAAERQLGREEEAANSEAMAVRLSTDDPILAEVKRLLDNGQIGPADFLVQKFLADTPNDPEALRLAAAIAARSDKLAQADSLLRRALSLTPSFACAKADMWALLHQQSEALDNIAAAKPASPPDASVQFEQAVRAGEDRVEKSPESARAWLEYGHMLRLAGRHEDSVAAYRRATGLKPDCGDAWWSIADLKTAQLNSKDRQQISEVLAAGSIDETDEIGLHFALGKAFGDAADAASSFNHYAAGNALKASRSRFDVSNVTEYVKKSEKIFSADFFKSREGSGHPARDPIFIVGMPRSGSTLVEQILASHGSVEGTEELPYLGNLAALLADGRRAGLERSSFVEQLTEAGPDLLADIGGAYLWNANARRLTSRPFFIDKTPRNWLYLPLIKMALPNARVIDVRRNPLECCWSNFRQLFADSGESSYSFDDLGAYYTAYVGFMDHFDHALPGFVHRVFYERLVSEPEAEVRSLADYLDIPFEPGMLRFHENPRAVKTSSSEQVRRPIATDSLNQAAPYEEWLAPLKTALGPVLAAYPDVPARLD
jgi:cytochrome c-type biogenesis protein CcmH/NrfG